MDNLLFALWKDPDCMTGRRQDLWLCPPTSGLGRLLAAFAIIGIAACLLDHAAAADGNADRVAATPYDSRQGSWK